MSDSTQDEPKVSSASRAASSASPSADPALAIDSVAASSVAATASSATLQPNLADNPPGKHLSRPSAQDRLIRQGIRTSNYLLTHRSAIKRWLLVGLGAIFLFSLFQNSQTVTYELLWWDLAFPQVVLSLLMIMVGITIGVFGYRALEELDASNAAYKDDSHEMAPLDPFFVDD